MIVDTHVHIISEDRVRQPLAPDASGWPTEGVTNPIDDLMRHMTEAGVDKAVLVQPASAYGYDNSYHADSQAKYAERIVSVGLLDPAAPDGPDRLAYWILERGMHGVRIAFARSNIDRQRADAFWRRAGELGIPITIAGVAHPDHIAHVRDMAARFPEVRIAPDHMAGWSASLHKPEMTTVLVELAKYPNVYLRISNLNLEPYESHADDEKNMLRRVIDAFTPERIMWGTNYPANRVGGYAAQVDIGRTALPFLSTEDREWILGGTALSVWPQLRTASKATAV